VITNALHEAAIDANVDCQRLALLNFMRTSRNQEEGAPVKRPIENYALLGKIDLNVNNSNKLAISYNFDHSKNENQTFDVPTYGNSANGTEGPSKINVLNANLFSMLSPTKVNEFTSPTRAKRGPARLSLQTSRRTRRWDLLLRSALGAHFSLDPMLTKLSGARSSRITFQL
jgi:hypothetical protein